MLSLIEDQVGAVRAAGNAGPVEKVRAVGYLACIALKAIEAGNLAARVEMLEAVLKQRSGEATR